MRILHTADWHLGARLARFSRLADQLARVDQILALCDEHRADVLLVAGDVFEDPDPDALEIIMRELAGRLQPRVAEGLSVLVLPGNHDQESIFPLLERVQKLGDSNPTAGAARVIFRAGPSIVSRVGRDGIAVQFLLLPYPRPSVYLDGAAPPAAGPVVRSRLAQAWRGEVGRLSRGAARRPNQPIVLVSHVLVRGADIGSTYRLSEQEDIPVEEGDLPGFAYIALGHIHKPQRVGGRRYAQYCGALERMNMGEKDHDRGVLLLDIGPDGLQEDPTFLHLPACPFYRIEVDGQEDMESLARRFVDQEPSRAYVEAMLRYTPGVDNPVAIEQEIHRIFPRCYSVLRRPRGSAVTPAVVSADRADVAGTARRYVSDAISDPEQRTRVLWLLDSVLEEVRP